MKIMRKRAHEHDHAGIAKIFYHGDGELLSSPARKSMDNFAIQAFFGQSVALLIGATYISGFLLRFNTSEVIVNYIGLIPSICAIVLVFASTLAQRVVRPKKTVMLLNLLAKTLLISIVYIPLFVEEALVPPIVVSMLICGYILNSFNNQIINNWFVKSIPEHIRGRYYSMRQVVALIANAVLPVIAGAVVDAFEEKYYAFIIIFSAAAVLAVCEMIMFARIPDCELQQSATKFKLIDSIRIPLKNKQFIKLLMYMGAFYFALYITASMRTTYMLVYLKLSYTYISAMGVMQALLQALLFYTMWGKVNDRLGPRFVFTTAVWMYAFDSLCWALTGTATQGYILITLGYLCGSIHGPAFTVGSFNYQYKIYPEEHRVMYSSFYSSYLGILLLIAPWVGTKLRELIVDYNFCPWLPNADFRIVTMLSTLLIIAVQVIFIVREKKVNPGSASLKGSSYKSVVKTLFNK